MKYGLHVGPICKFLLAPFAIPKDCCLQGLCQLFNRDLSGQSAKGKGLPDQAVRCIPIRVQRDSYRRPEVSRPDRERIKCVERDQH